MYVTWPIALISRGRSRRNLEKFIHVFFCFALCCVVDGGKYVDWREHGGGAAD